MAKPLSFRSLRSALRPRDLVDYWRLSKKIQALERKEGESHYGCEIVSKVQRKLRGRFCHSLLRNLRPLRYWTHAEVVRIRHMALRTAIKLVVFDTHANKAGVKPKIKRQLLAARRRLMKSFPLRCRGVSPSGELANWMKKLDAERKALGIGKKKDVKLTHGR